MYAGAPQASVLKKNISETLYRFCPLPSGVLYYFDLQSLAVVTLGDRQMAQRIDNLVDTEELKRFYFQVGLIMSQYESFKPVNLICELVNIYQFHISFQDC